MLHQKGYTKALSQQRLKLNQGHILLLSALLRFYNKYMFISIALAYKSLFSI